MSDCVQTVSHNLLVRELSTVTAWDVFGTYLGLDESEIEVIEHDHNDTARRRIVMLDRWMKKDVNASWEKVIDSLNIMSQFRLANQLKEKYCISASNPPAAAGPIAESSSEQELMVDRQEQIACEIEDLGEKYLLLVTSIESTLLEVNPPPLKLKRFSKYYLKPRITSVEELFDELEPFNFLDYALLEKLVKFFMGQSDTGDNLSDYIQQLTDFKSSTTVQQFMDSIEQAQQSYSEMSEKPGLCIVKLRLVGGWLTKTMDDLEKLVNEIFKDKMYVLSHLKIVRGSVIVTYSAPLSEADSLILLAREQSPLAIRVGVSELLVGDTIVTASRSWFYSFVISLHRAIEDDDLNVLSFLLSINTSPDAADNRGRTALTVAVYYNRDKAVALLLQANGNPNLQGDYGVTPLSIASWNGHTDSVSLLLKANANPNLQSNIGSIPLFIASQKGHTDTVALLLEANANPNTQTNDGAAPLFIASQNGNTGAIALLLKANANPNIQRNDGATPLLIASQNGHTESISLLLKYEANPNLQANDGDTPLYVASQNNHNDVITLLLNAKANPNYQRDDGATPLLIASQEGLTEAITLLLKAKANPNIQMAGGATPLSHTCLNGHTDATSLLLEANANPNLQVDDGATPLFFASQTGRTDIVTLLLKANAKPNLQREIGTTPLMVAALHGHSQVVQVLLASGADPNLQQFDGLTALMLASHAGCLDVVELLLMSGADSSLLGPQGLTALDMAASLSHKDIVDLLQIMVVSQSSTTSPVLTAKEIASNVDNEALALLNRAVEQILVKKTESRITAEYQKLKKTLPFKHYEEEPQTIL